MDRKDTSILDLFRFIAAFVVVIFHFGKDTPLAKLAYGFMTAGIQMVTFFFVLSGFVMTLSYMSDKPFKIMDYAVSRIARIVPLYLLALGWCMYYHFDSSSTYGAYGQKGLWLSLSFSQAWVPGYAESLNEPAWSLSVEFFLYAMLPAAILPLRRWRPSPWSVFIVAISVWLTTQFILLYSLNSDWYEPYPSKRHDLSHFFPPVHLCSFLLGVAGAYWIKYNNKTSNGLWNVACILSVILVTETFRQGGVLYHIGSWITPYRVSWLSPMFLLLIITSTLTNMRLKYWLSNRVFRILGASSYAIYILHKPVHIMCCEIAESLEIFPDWKHNSYFFCLYAVILTALSLLATYIIEQPARWLILQSWAKIKLLASMLKPSSPTPQNDSTETT